MKWIYEVGIDTYFMINSESSTDIFTMKACSLLGNHWKIVCLGNNALKKTKKHIPDVELFLMPHPSYRNRQLNNPKFEKQKLQELKEWLNDSHQAGR